MSRRPHRAALLCFALLTLAPGCRGGPRPAVLPSAPASDALHLLQGDLDTLLAAPSLARGTWGVLIKSLARDEVLYAANPQRLLLPASNMKLVTLAVAADRLGWDYTYETRLVSTAAIHDGILDGDLVVVGSGDPSFDDWDGAATRIFQSWADRLKALGIQRIAGRLIGDGRAFANEPFGAGWAWDDLAASYATAVGALQFNENTARVLITPGDRVDLPADVRLEQPGSGLLLRAAVNTTAGAPASVTTRRLAGSPWLDVRGGVPLGLAPVAVNVSVVNPAMYFLNALRARLIESGIEISAVSDNVADLTPSSKPVSVLLSHRSAPLAELATTMMKNSQNLYAETLLRTLGGQPATFEAARVTAESLLRSWGVGAGTIIIADGSGLSRTNLITPEATVAVLTHMDRDERSRTPFEDSLPVAGVDGTLAQRFRGTAAERQVHAKTGSFTNVRAIAGYAHSADGEPLVFSIMANNYGVPADVVERTEDAIVIRIAQFSRR